MDENLFFDLITTAINNYIRNSGGVACELTLQTKLMGKSSPLDSLGLINVLIDLENSLKNKNINISFLSEKAMSMENSPFISIASLIQFIKEQNK